MMGHREKMKGGDEVDALTKTGRRYVRFRAGEAKAVKAKFSRRIRRKAKQQCVTTEESWDDTPAGREVW